MKVDQKIQDLIRDRNTQVPTLPVIVEKILSMAQEENTSAKILAELISKDPAIANKILRLSNSAYYGMMKEIDSIPRAITIIGFNEVVSLTIGMSVVSAFSRKDAGKNFNMKGLWIHSLGCAFASRNIAKKLGILQSEQIFISGLLHDMGKIIFAIYFTDEYAAVLSHAKENETELYRAERLILGINHATLTGMLMEQWNFPEMIHVPARDHHSVEDSPSRYQKLALIVAFSDYLSQKAEFGDSWTIKVPVITRIREELGISRDEADEMVERLKEQKDEIEAFFEVMK
ncbi:MAG: HDOD domain-containing protein [Deltaproteobacteria bacterium]|nr:HDOD domain-containing protein [Deltaproteobacteria bacterium]